MKKLPEIEQIKIEPYQNGQEVEIAELIKRVYDEFVACDYSDEGNRFFYDWIQPDKIAKRQAEGRTIFIAKSQAEIVGMIETRDNNRISLLFVDKAFQGGGIAKKLFWESLQECKKRNHGLDKFYVHASPYSITIYKKLGFIEVSSMQEDNGINYMPMEMNII